MTSSDPAVLAVELKATLDEYIGALRSLHAGVTGGGIVKDPGAGEGDSVPVEVPAEVVDYLDQGKKKKRTPTRPCGTHLGPF